MLWVDRAEHLEDSVHIDLGLVGGLRACEQLLLSGGVKVPHEVKIVVNCNAVTRLKSWQK